MTKKRYPQEKLNFEDAIQFVLNNQKGTRDELLNKIGPEMFEQLAMLGYIKQGVNVMDNDKPTRSWIVSDKATFPQIPTDGSSLDNLLLKLEESEALSEKYKRQIAELNDQLINKSKSEAEQEQIRKERDSLRKELDFEIERKKRETTENIKNAFLSLDSATGDLNLEVNRLNSMYKGYIVAMFTCVLLMIVVWIRYFTNADSEGTVLSFWYYLSPNVILVTASLICLFQAQKCQRQIVLLKKFLYKPKQIQGLLDAYVHLSKEENNEVKVKANEIFDKYINHIICNDINIDNEEKNMNQEDGKEKSTQEAIAKAITDLSSYFKSS